ncbi:MAG: two-component system, NarL family, sensor kinase [Gaiellaceae bacterium]|jgi:signal transduction histidine kinase|nr:two-component system, NarL family, sensor kinase [Gaiellaceae bacterium]
MPHDDRDSFESWLFGQVLLGGLLGASLGLFLAYPTLRHAYQLPELRLVLQTTAMLASGAVAVLAGLRFSVEGRRVDLLLSGGFFLLAAVTLTFSILPVLGGHPIRPAHAWSLEAGRLAGWTLIATAPFLRGRARRRERTLGNTIVVLGFVVGGIWAGVSALGSNLPDLAPAAASNLPSMLIGVVAAQALLNLAAVVGFGRRFQRKRDDLDRWLGLGSTLMLFASLSNVFTPLPASGAVTPTDFLRVVAFGVLLLGVWRSIRFSEFGRAVAEERARVAREIHDGLAQYLFAISTHTGMLERGNVSPETIASLKEAAAAAQQEARFAVLALSSASGTAPFDSALRRYVDFLTADGSLEVDIDIDPDVRLDPDEQIEIFRIVQEGLANVRKHACATRAELAIELREGRRIVSIHDDGEGFDAEIREGTGQGLKNIRARSASIQGGFDLRSKPGLGTALEVVLRT